MKIALIVDHDPDLVNGASSQSRQFISWLTGHGHEVELIFPSPGRRTRPHGPGVRHHPIPALSIARYREYCVPLPPLNASLWLDRPDVDVVHAETINPTLLLLGYWISRRRRVPLFNVLTANVPFYYPILFPPEKWFTGPLLRFGKGLANRLSDRIEGTFVLSPGMKKTLTRRFFSFDPKKVFVLARPLDRGRFAVSVDPPGLDRLRAVPRGRRLLTLSRLCTTKNVEFLVKAFARSIYPRNKDLHFFVAGDGPQAADLKRLAAELGCPHIHFLGSIPFEAVPALLRAADYFLYGSLSETFGNAVCEAKFAPLPVIALDDRGGVRAQILDRRTGILVGAAREKEFARRFFEVFDDAGLRSELRRQARRDVILNNDPEKIYSRLLGLYHRAVRREPLEEGEVGRLFSFDRSFLRRSEERASR